MALFYDLKTVTITLALIIMGLFMARFLVISRFIAIYYKIIRSLAVLFIIDYAIALIFLFGITITFYILYGPTTMHVTFFDFTYLLIYKIFVMQDKNLGKLIKFSDVYSQNKSFAILIIGASIFII